MFFGVNNSSVVPESRRQPAADVEEEDGAMSGCEEATGDVEEEFTNDDDEELADEVRDRFAMFYVFDDPSRSRRLFAAEAEEVVSGDYVFNDPSRSRRLFAAEAEEVVSGDVGEEKFSVLFAASNAEMPSHVPCREGGVVAARRAVAARLAAEMQCKRPKGTRCAACKARKPGFRMFYREKFHYVCGKACRAAWWRSL